MSFKQPRIWLASQSPRRRELLNQVGVHFEVLLLRNDPLRQIDVDEVVLQNETAEVYVERVCGEKSQAAWQAVILRNLSQSPVLTADTIVTVDGQIMGKPRDDLHAAEMLQNLSGRQHQVLTAIGVGFGNRFEYRVSTSTITFAQLSEERISRYLLSGEARDKAGAYGIQGQASAFVERLEGSYSGVVGLPLFETVELLNSFGVPTP
jgi:septum formation protein